MYFTHSQQFFGMIVLSPCKRLNQTFHLSTIDIFPMQKGCHMNNLCSLFCHEIFILVPSSFQRAEQYIQVLFGETFVQESRHMMRMRIMPLGWDYADLLKQTDWWNWSWTIKLEFSNLIDYLSCTSTIRYWIKKWEKTEIHIIFIGEFLHFHEKLGVAESPF